MKFLVWHFFNLITGILSLSLVFATGFIIFHKFTVESESTFFFQSWWHTIFLIILIWIPASFLINIFDTLNPRSHTVKREKKQQQRANRDYELSRSETNELTMRKKSYILPALSLGTLGLLWGGGAWRTDRYRIQQYSSRKGTRSGTSSTVGGRDDAVHRAYKWMKRNPAGEVIVTDQKTQNVILHLP